MLYGLLTSIFYDGSSGIMPKYSREIVKNIMTPIVVSESIQFIENHYESKLERIKDGKIKYARATGNHIGRDDEQNQLSAS